MNKNNSIAPTTNAVDPSLTLEVRRTKKIRTGIKAGGTWSTDVRPPAF
jgi:hypothetical protein